MNTKRVLIVEDEAEVCEEYKRLIREKHPGLCLAGEADNRGEALSVLQSAPVDVVLLDLELQGENGIAFLEELQELPIEKPFIIVVTKVVSVSLLERARELGADTFCAKKGKCFTFDEPLIVAEIAGGFRKSKRSAEGTGLPSGNLPPDTGIPRKEALRKEIEASLAEMQFPLKKCGTRQCVEALLYMILSGKQDINLSGDVYPHVALLFNTDKKNVEKNIRCVIEAAWKQNDIARSRRLYPYSRLGIRKRPTNAEFLAAMVRMWM